MIFDRNTIDRLSVAAYWSDREVRTDLIAGYIANENDYTSNFTGTLRRKINAMALPGLNATSYVLKPKLERKLGADACIIFANETEFKVCIFEAKWPRLSMYTNYWDSIQKSTGCSHFDEQVERQKKYSKSFAIWEMFYFEHGFGKQTVKSANEVSGCVWHKDVVAFRNGKKTAKWTDVQLLKLLRKHNTSISNIVQDVCSCKVGLPIKGQNYLKALEEHGSISEALVVKKATPEDA
ncbi:hypothetical protein [Vibrio parahaemolyticus]|uniref:hypothetical protein n=1 Tax=Vibrio parahaemolyticus TaxID=670 RepID=UPI00040BC1AF|nr:hypothetical protein [Vibrio parahaemolyticus]